MQPSIVVFRRLPTLNSLRFSSTDTNVPQKTDGKDKVLRSKEINNENAVYDKVTHTGQAWDQADYRLSRFAFNPKQVNPNIAAHLVAEQAPVASEDHVVWCDGGHPATGHPKVYINLDKPGTHACGYCGKRFFNTHTTKPEDMHIAHIEV